MRVYRRMMARGGTRLLARMNKVRVVIVPILVVAALTIGAPTAEAVPLVPGSTVGAAPIPGGFPGGAELASVFYLNQVSGDLVASVGSAVLRNAGGTLDFYYQVTNNSPVPPADEIHRLTGSSFSGFITDVWWVINGSAVPCAACGGTFQDGSQDPLTVDRSSGLGSVVGFNFPSSVVPGVDLNEVDPGETSVVLLIRTDATIYRPGLVSVINSGTVTRPAFAPARQPQVPEPASLLLFGIGLLGTGAAMRHRRKA